MRQILFFILLVLGNFISAQDKSFDNDLRMSFDIDDFTDYNNVLKVDSTRFLKNYKGGAFVYKKNGSDLLVDKKFFLSSDAKCLNVSNLNIELIDWSNTLYSFNKENYDLNFKIQLNYVPSSVMSVHDTTIVLTINSAYIYKRDSCVGVLDFESPILQYYRSGNALNIITQQYRWIDVLGAKLKFQNPFILMKFPKNSSISNVFFSPINSKLISNNNELNYAFDFKVENIVKCELLGKNLLLLNNKNEFLIHSESNETISIEHSIDFSILDDSTVAILSDSKIKHLNTNSLSILISDSIPHVVNARKIFYLDQSIFVTFKDRSFLYKENKKNDWFIVNEEIGFRSNIDLIGSNILFSGDNMLVNFDFLTNEYSFDERYYYFSKSSSTNQLSIGGVSGAYNFSDSLIQNVYKSKFLDKKLLLDKGFRYNGFYTLYFHQNTLALVCNDKVQKFENVMHHQKLNDSSFLYTYKDTLVIASKSDDVFEYQNYFFNEKLLFAFQKGNYLYLLLDNYSLVRLNKSNGLISILSEEFMAISDIIHLNDSLCFFSSWDGKIATYNTFTNQLKIAYKHDASIASMIYDDKTNNLLFLDLSGCLNIIERDRSIVKLKIYHSLQYGIFVRDAYGRFDGSPEYIESINYYCGKEIIDLSQVKDSLWVPGLVEKIMTGQDLLINDRPAPKLSELNICGLTPVIEPLERGKQGEYLYRVISRRGGLGETEVYINGNLTFSFLPKDLDKNQDGTYLLRLPSDSIQPYLSGGMVSSSNPMLVKAKIKGASIYGRGEILDVPVELDEGSPRFFGVFVGVNDYGNPNKESSYTRFNDLDYASKDASDLSLVIEASARALFKDSTFIYRLSNDSLQDYNPNKENLTRVFEDIGKKAKANDVLFVFFAGHGSIDDKGKIKEIKFMLEKADKRNKASTGFGVADLSNWCHPKKVKAQKRVFVFDACHSGQFVNEQMAMAQGGRGGDEESTRIRQLDKLKDKNGMMILAAAADDQSAYEDVTLDQGVLTYHLLDAMKSEKRDTSLTVNKWFEQTISRVEEYASRNGHNQSPNSFGSGRFEIGNINQDVREQIDIVPPKIRMGNCVFLDPTGEAETNYPNLIQSINKALSQMNGRGESFVYSTSDKTYTARGGYHFRKNKLYMRYKIYYDNKEVAGIEPIVLGPFKNKSEKEITFSVLESFKNAVSKVTKIKE